MMTVLVGMFLLGLFIALGTWTVSWSNHVKRELVVKVDFKMPQVDAGAGERRRPQAAAEPARQARRHQVRLEGAGRSSSMKKRYPELVKNLPSNPLPRLARGDAEQGREHRQALRLEPAAAKPPGVDG